MRSIFGSLLIVISLTICCSDNSTGPSLPPPGEKTPPATITDLEIVEVTRSRVNLGWTSPGDDGMEGRILRYDLRYAEYALTDSNWESATAFWEIGVDSAGRPAQCTITHLRSDVTYYFGIKAIDDNNNRSAISNIVSATLLPPGMLEWVGQLPGTAMASYNSFLYLRDHKYEMIYYLTVYDITDPSHPIQAGLPTELVDRPLYIAGYNDKLYSTSYMYAFYYIAWPSVLYISQALPSIPIVLGSYSFNYNPTDTTYDGPKFHDMVINGDIIYLRYTNRIVILDAGDVADLHKIGEYVTPEGHTGLQLHIMDSVLIVSGGVPNHWIDFLNISDSDSIDLISSYDAGGIVLSIEPAGKLLCFFVSENHELRLMDISNPAQPNVTGTLSLSSPAYTIASLGDYIYYNGLYNIYVIDPANPAAPVIVDSCDVSNGSLMSDGTYLFSGTSYYPYFTDIFRPHTPEQ
ncbi:MAG: hypothetical protein AB1746_09775 [Candidatus Zixiibacteriota bacterium]